MDLLHEPLTSLTVARGLEPQLTVWPAWRDLQIGASAGPACLWSLAGNPYQMYLAAPLPGPQVAELCDHLLQKEIPGWPRTATSALTARRMAMALPGAICRTSSPSSKLPATTTRAGSTPACSRHQLRRPSAAPGLIQDILRRTNLVYYDWEVTGPRLQPSLQVAQTTRLITRHPQLSLDSAGLTWLGAMIPRLGTSATIITRTGPAELTLRRVNSATP